MLDPGAAWQRVQITHSAIGRLLGLHGRRIKEVPCSGNCARLGLALYPAHSGVVAHQSLTVLPLRT